MSDPRSRKAVRTTRRAIELTLAVPQVVAHRVARAALAGTSPSLRDRREFHRMGTEKIAAFYESWNAMVIEIFRNNVRLCLSPMRWWTSSTTLAAGSRAAARHGQAALAIFDQGMSPYHRRAVANAKRLARVRVR